MAESKAELRTLLDSSDEDQDDLSDNDDGGVDNNAGKHKDKKARNNDDDADEGGTEGETGRVRISKKKVALVMGYSGFRYKGMQIQKDSETIEKELFEALRVTGAITEQNAVDAHKFNFMRAARTDKGVHAAGQVCSLKIHADKDYVPLLNAVLPEDIRIFGTHQVISSFHAKRMCDSRIYEYFIPTYMFARQPSAQRKAIEAHEAAKAAAHAAATEAAAANPTETPAETSGTKTDEAVPAAAAISFGRRPFPVMTDEESSDATSLYPNAEGRRKYRISADELARLRVVLGKYEGFHNFHNYTSKREAKDPSSRRKIHWFKALEPHVHDGVEWVQLQVKGQSFMLHQIRKMVGMAVAIMRFDARALLIERTFEHQIRMVPRAPGAGLFLDTPQYDSYNNRLLKVGFPRDPFKMEAYRDQMEAFKQGTIYPIIRKQEAEDQFVEFLRIMDHYTDEYGYFWDS